MVVECWLIPCGYALISHLGIKCSTAFKPKVEWVAEQAVPGCSYSSNHQRGLARKVCPGMITDVKWWALQDYTNVELIRGVSPLQTQIHCIHCCCHHPHSLPLPPCHHHCWWHQQWRVYRHGCGNAWHLHLWWSSPGSRCRWGQGGNA